MILDLFKLDGKVALVTGAGRGLGQGMAIALAEAGADVAGLGTGSLDDTAAQVQALGRRFLPLNFNLLENQIGTPPLQSEKTLKKVKELLNIAIEECRDISQDLSPKVLEDFGLAPALDEIAQRILGQHGIWLRYQPETYRGTSEKSREITLFRIAQELIANVAAHARASEVKISIGQAKNKNVIVLKITDNGLGFDRNLWENAEINSGFKNVQNRVVLLGGKAYLRTNSGKGTSFLIEVPA